MAYNSTVLEKYEYHPKYWRFAVATAFSALALNLVIYVAAVAAGIFTSLQFKPVSGGELTIGPVAIVSFITPLCAFAVFRVLSRGHDDIYPIFRGATILAVATSLWLPLMITSWTWSQILTTQLMHVVVGAASIFGLARWELADR